MKSLKLDSHCDLGIIMILKSQPRHIKSKITTYVSIAISDLIYYEKIHLDTSFNINNFIMIYSTCQSPQNETHLIHDHF